MYEVLIVDDEPMVGVMIKSLVNWEAHGVLISHEAVNGKQALKILEEHPDINIVITDMDMPVMNGLQLITEMKKRLMQPEVIVLSAYEDYGLVRNAFKLGVTDYILKTELDPESLLRLINNVIGKLGAKKSDKERNIIKNSILKELVESEDYEESVKKFADFGIKIAGFSLAVCFLWVDDYRSIEERYKDLSLKPFIASVLNSIYQSLKPLGLGEAISLSPQEYVLILGLNETDPEQAKSKIEEILENIKRQLFNYVNIQVSIGVSRIGSEYGEIRNLFIEAEKHARLRFVFGKQSIVFPEHTAQLVNEHEHNHMIGDKADELIEALKDQNRDKTLEELDNLLRHIGSYHFGKIEEAYMSYFEIIFILIKVIEGGGEEAEKVFGNDTGMYKQITMFETSQEINEWIRDRAIQVLDFMKNHKKTKMIDSISQALDLIQMHFGNENLSLKMVSRYVSLSENHFSMLFTKAVGIPFTDYMINLRINKAKELMEDPNLKIYEICESVGYRSVEHFSRIFKKVTGYSPNSFRNRQN